MNLATLQREVARAVMTPLTPSERMRRKAPNGKSPAQVAARIIKPNDRLTSFERLEIYNRQYWFRVLDGFYEDFPGLRAVLGDRRFDRLAKAYLTNCPSRSFTMRDLGSRLERWLRSHPEFAVGPASSALMSHRGAGFLRSMSAQPNPSSRSAAALARHPRLQLALDMVRLEWAEIETFDSAALPPITAASLSSSASVDPGKSRSSAHATFTSGRSSKIADAVLGNGGRAFRSDITGTEGKRALASEELSSRQINPAKLRLKLQPYIRLLDLRYPVDDLLLAIKHDAGTNVASNAIAERQKRRKVSAVAKLRPVPTYLAVHRVDNMVYFRRLEREEFAILAALHNGKTLQRAIELGFRGSRTPIAQQAADAGAWFHNWAALGWFVAW